MTSRSLEFSKVVHVGLIGPTNAGKSTLLNSINKKKVSIVSHKVQTTRAPVEVPFDYGQYRIIFTDTPGFIDKHYKDNLNSFINKSIFSVSATANLLFCVFDAKRLVSGEGYREYFLKFYKMARQQGGEKLKGVILNKVDLVSKEQLLGVLASIAKDTSGEVDIVPVSSKQPKTIEHFLTHLENLFDGMDGLMSYDYQVARDDKFYISEVIREAVYKFLHQELPYDIGVQVVVVQETEQIVKVVANIVVDRDQQKGMVIGKGGQKIKSIGSLARRELKKEYKKNVFLDLKVKVINNWKLKDNVFNSMIRGEV